MIQQNQPEKKDKLEELLERFEREQREFDNHWLWKELHTTPKQFFAFCQKQVEQSGIDEKVWQEKLATARKAVEVQVREASGQYKAVEFKNFRGLRA